MQTNTGRIGKLLTCLSQVRVPHNYRLRPDCSVNDRKQRFIIDMTHACQLNDKCVSETADTDTT